MIGVTRLSIMRLYEKLRKMHIDAQEFIFEAYDSFDPMMNIACHTIVDRDWILTLQLVGCQRFK